MAHLATTSALPSLAAATTDLWPSIASTVMIPFRSAALSNPRRPSATLQGTSATSPSIAASSHRHYSPATARNSSSATETSRVNLPEFLRDARHDAHLSAPALPPSASFDIRSSLSSLDRASLMSLNPVRRRFLPFGLPPRRPMSTTTAFRPSSGPLANLMASQSRGFRTGGLSRNLLAHMEESANRNPSSATAQNAFYQALLKANMPAIIIERYQSGRFAANAAATDAYHKAVGMTATSAGAIGSGEGDIAEAVKNSSGSLSQTQVQAITQAVAARVRGGNLAVSKGNTGSGTKEGPLHVVVDETMGGTIFRWIKFFLWFGLVTYLSLVIITMLIEGMSIFSKAKPGGLGGGSSDKEVKAEQQKARFSDVHGADEAKEEVMEVVEFLRNPDKFSQLGGKLPKGILLVGPPGTGKTLLARAVAGEAGVPFFYMSGSEFDEVFVGVGAKRVRDLFSAAKAKSPAIVFIDELDAIGGRRSGRDQAYSKQTLNQLLTELDGFDQSSNIIIIAATNFPESLDKALTRPGRFDRHVVVDLPDVRGRLAILKHHAKRIKAQDDVDLQAIALLTSGLSGAELENIVNQAAIHASKSKATSVKKADFDWAKDKIIMGAERRSMVFSAEEKEMTAYHEAGHALMTLFTKGAQDSLYKVTVLPRGYSLGHTARLPEMDKYSMTVDDFMGNIAIALGGKLAEEIVYGTGRVTSGASSDLEAATATAFHMISKLGMSVKAGNVEWGSRYKSLSSETRAMIEAEVQRTVDESYARSRKVLVEHRKELDLLAQALVQYETLNKEEVEKVIRGEPLVDRIAVPKGPMKVPMPNKLSPTGDVRPLPGNDEDENPPPPPPATTSGYKN